jgi:hypothetical protein
MEVKPVQHVEQPGYPTRRELLAGAMSFALLSLTKCSFVFAESEEGKIKVAPIFKHGEGRGATGCVVVSPPAFLSEEEALQIVKEELAKHGVKLAAGPVLKDLTIAPRHIQQVEQDKKTRKIVLDEAHAAPLHVTGMDEKKSIAIEFVCRSNYKKLGGVDPDNHISVVDRDGHDSGMTVLSTVKSYDFKDAAEYVAGQVKKQGKHQVFFGVFYNSWPEMPRPDRSKNGEETDWKAELEAWEKRNSEGKKESEKLLRQQAQDFVAWLKEQKAIQ